MAWLSVDNLPFSGLASNDIPFGFGIVSSLPYAPKRIYET